MPEVRRNKVKPLYVAALLGALALAGASVQVASRAAAERPAPISLPMLSLDHRDGALYRHGATAPFTGTMFEQYPSGVLKSRTAISHGRIHGLSEGFFTNGATQVVEIFKNGTPDGSRTVWHANGQLKSEGLLVNGKQEGLFRRWHENGKPEIEANFKDGKPDGPSRSWHPSGNLKSEATMRAGEVVERHFYNDDGTQPAVPLTNTPTP